MKILMWLLAFILLLVPSTATAQPADSWQNLQQLRKGRKVEIVDMKLKKLLGKFVSVNDTAITFHDEQGEQTLPREQVFRVSVQAGTKRLRHAAIGAAVGAAAGLITGALIDRSFSEEGEHIAKTILTPAGAGAGAGIGSAFAGFQTLYRAQSKTP